MTKAVKCQKCGLYYNSAVFDACSHCNMEMWNKENFKRSIFEEKDIFDN